MDPPLLARLYTQGQDMKKKKNEGAACQIPAAAAKAVLQAIL